MDPLMSTTPYSFCWLLELSLRLYTCSLLLVPTLLVLASRVTSPCSRADRISSKGHLLNLILLLYQWSHIYIYLYIFFFLIDESIDDEVTEKEIIHRMIGALWSFSFVLDDCSTDCYPLCSVLNFAAITSNRLRRSFPLQPFCTYPHIWNWRT